MKNETFSLNNSKHVVNNSSMFTAENSSTFISRINNRKNRLNTLIDSKYTNTAIFDISKRELSNPHTIKKKKREGLYLTDLSIRKYKETETDTNVKSTLESTKINFTNNNNKTRQTNKDLLPNITEYYRHKKYFKNPECFTCCERRLNPNCLIRLYNDQIISDKINIGEVIRNKSVNRKEDLKDKKEDRITYLKKTLDIKKIRYEIDLKKEAILEYKDNLKTQLNSINHTISTIKAYKDNLENNYMVKFNKDLRNLGSKLLDEKTQSDIQNKELLILKKDVSSLQFAIRKKDKTLKEIEKWLILQIYIKEGIKPKDLKNKLKDYNNKLIFETPEELEMSFKDKEDKNIRLLLELNKINNDKFSYKNQLLEIKNEDIDLKNKIDKLIIEKEKVLESLKKRKVELDIKLNNLSYLKLKNNQKKNKVNNKRSKSVNNSFVNINNNNDGEIKINALGVFYKPIKIYNNLYVLIDCAYNAILKNNITNLSLSLNDLNEIKNSNTSRTRKAVVQMKIIEIGLDFLYSSIQQKINLNKDNLKIIEETCQIIDLYHKRVNGNKNKLEQEMKRNEIMKKVEEKNKKVYYLPKGKIERYNVVAIKKIKDIDKLKNKKIKKKIDIWDFLYDQEKYENKTENKKI